MQENLPKVVVCAIPHIHLEWPLVVGAPSGVQVAIRLSLMAGWWSGRRAQGDRVGGEMVVGDGGAEMEKGYQ